MIFYFFQERQKNRKRKKMEITVDFPLTVQKRSLFLPVTFTALLEWSYCSGIRIHWAPKSALSTGNNILSHPGTWIVLCHYKGKEPCFASHPLSACPHRRLYCISHITHVWRTPPVSPLQFSPLLHTPLYFQKKKSLTTIFSTFPFAKLDSSKLKSSIEVQCKLCNLQYIGSLTES